MYWEYYFTIENVLVTCHIFVSILSIIRERYKNVAELIINILSFSKGGILDKFTKIIERYWLFLNEKCIILIVPYLSIQLKSFITKIQLIDYSYATDKLHLSFLIVVQVQLTSCSTAFH